MKILCFGDSNTYGYDPRDSGRYDEKLRWVDLLSTCGHETINEGLNGREIPNSVPEYGYLNSVIRRNTNIDVLILALGVNDAYNMRSPSAKKIVERWEKVFENVPAIKELQEKGIPIILISPPVGPTAMWGEDRSEEILEALENMAEAYESFAKKVGIIFADGNKFGVELAYDGVHFTEKGSLTFFENIKELLKRCC